MPRPKPPIRGPRKCPACSGYGWVGGSTLEQDATTCGKCGGAGTEAIVADRPITPRMRLYIWALFAGGSRKKMVAGGWDAVRRALIKRGLVERRKVGMSLRGEFVLTEAGVEEADRLPRCGPCGGRGWIRGADALPGTCRPCGGTGIEMPAVEAT